MLVETLNCSHGQRKKASIFSVDVSVLGEIATGGGDGAVSLWKSPQTFAQHAGAVLCVRFDSSGEVLASSSDDKTISIYTKKSDKFSVLKKLCDHTSDVHSLCWTKKLLVSAGCDGNVNFYDTEGFVLLKSLDVGVFIKGMAVDPLYRCFCVQDDRGVGMYNMDGKFIVRNEKIAEGNVVESLFSRMSFSADAKFLAVGLSFNNKANSVEILDMQLASMYSLMGHVAPSEVVSFNPNVFAGRERYYVIAVASQDRSLSLWNSMNSRPFLLLKNLVSAPVLDMRWSKDGETLVVCTYDGEVKRLSFSKKELGTPCDYGQADSKLPLTYEYYELGKSTPDEACDQVGDTRASSDEFSRKRRKNPAALRIGDKKSEKAGTGTPAQNKKPESRDSVSEKPRRVRPKLIAPPEKVGDVVLSEGESQLFIFRSIKRPLVDKSTVKRFAKITGEYKVEYNLERAELLVYRGTKLCFRRKRRYTHVCLGTRYLVLVVSEGEFDKIETLCLRLLAQEMPSFYSCGVATVDMMQSSLLLLETTGNFKVIDLDKRRLKCAGQLPFGGNINVNLCRRHFLVADNSGELYFYSRKMDLWFKMRNEYGSILTKKANFSETSDRTLEEIYYRFIVARESGNVDSMKKYARRIFLLLRKQSTPDDLLENKICGVVTSLVRVGEDVFVDSLLSGLCKNYSLHYLVYDMKKIAEDLRAQLGPGFC